MLSNLLREHHETGFGTDNKLGCEGQGTMEEGLYLLDLATKQQAFSGQAAVHRHLDGHARLWGLIWQPKGLSEALSVF